MTEKIVFNRDVAEKLNMISMKIAPLLYDEIEKLDLTPKEKVFAHYWVIKHYLDGMQKALDEMGIEDVVVKEK